MSDETALVRWYECERKVRYATLAEAEEKAFETMRNHPVRNNGRATNLEPYECGWCRGYHYGRTQIALRQRNWGDRLSSARHLASVWRRTDTRPPITSSATPFASSERPS